MKKYFTIGETAKINNISIQALRLYDKMGLLKPAFVDQESNYRYYSIDQFMYIDLIKYSKTMGAPLKEIRDVLQKKDIGTLLSFIKKQQRTVKKEIVRLKNISNAMVHIENKIKYAMDLKKTNEIYYRNIDKRFVIYTLLNKEDKKSDVEIKLRSLDKILEDNDIILGEEIGYFINLDLLINSGKMEYKSIYETIYKNTINNKIDINEIQGGKFICIAYFNNEREKAVDIIRKYIKENNILPKGIGIQTELLNTIQQWEKDDLLYELQILI